MNRVYNFSPGPATMPLSVLQKVQAEMLSYGETGASVMELSHRGKPFVEILENCTADLRKLLNLPEKYDILFLQGGARLQFSMVPMNLLAGATSTADYVITGSWGKKALSEARKAGDIRVAWDGKESAYSTLPAASELNLTPDAAYVHITSNETIEGVQFSDEPDTGNVPLVCDSSSDFLHRPLPMDRYGMIYACAQKNVGPAGVTIVVIRKDLLSRGADSLPGMLNYRNFAEQNSLYNTLPTFAIYVAGLVCRWLLEEIGGLEAMAQLNRKKAALLYDELDASGDFYQGHADPSCRSLMNVTFRLPSDELTQQFISEAKTAGLHALGGHRSVGGIRASIYNAMPMEGVVALRDFMASFRKQNS